MIACHAHRLDQELNRLGVAHDLKVHPDAGHSFMTRPPNLALKLLGAALAPACRIQSVGRGRRNAKGHALPDKASMR